MAHDSMLRTGRSLTVLGMLPVAIACGGGSSSGGKASGQAGNAGASEGGAAGWVSNVDDTGGKNASGTHAGGKSAGGTHTGGQNASGAHSGGSHAGGAGPEGGGHPSTGGGHAGSSQGTGAASGAAGSDGGSVSSGGTVPSEGGAAGVPSVAGGAPEGGFAGKGETGGGGETSGGTGGATGGDTGTGGELALAGSAGAPGCSDVADAVVFADGANVSTVTGTGSSGTADGTTVQARFNNPVNVAVSGELVYVADFLNDSIRVVDRVNGTVATLYASDGAPFCHPFGLAIGGPNQLFVSTDCGPTTTMEYPTYTEGAIWTLDTAGGSEPQLLMEVNGRARGILFMAADVEHPSGQLVFSDQNGHTIRALDLATSGESVLAGMPGYSGFADGTGSAARFDWPYGLAELDGDVIVADKENHALRRVTLGGVVTTIVGDDCPGLVDGPVASARFNQPQDVATDAQGNIYVADRGNQRIRVLHAGQVRTLAGGDEATFVDGTGSSARFFGMEGFDLSESEPALVIADGSGGEELPFHRIRLLTIPSLD
jgi:hypothetical protein